MAVLESTALSLAKTIVQKAAAAWLADRRATEERTTELSSQLVSWFRPASPEQRFVDEAASGLAAFGRHEFRGLDDGDREAALLAVLAAFERADLSDRGLMAVDFDPVKLAAELRAKQPSGRVVAGLGEAGGAFYDAALDHCCSLYVRAAIHLQPFLNRSMVEMLSRISDLPDRVATRVRDARHEPPVAAADPRADADAVVADRVRHLVDDRASILAGRGPEFAMLNAYVATNMASPIVVRAPAGFGKTTLLAAWTRQRGVGAMTLASHFFAVDRDLTSVEDAYRQLLRQIAAAVPALTTDLNGDVEQLQVALHRALKAWPDHSDGRLVVVLDALDEARQIPASPMFPLPLPERVSVILSTRASADGEWLVPNLDVWTAGGAVLELAPLDRDGLHAWLQLANPQLSNLVSEEVPDALAMVSGGFPIFVRFLLDELLSVAGQGGNPREWARELTAAYGNAEATFAGDVPAGFARYVGDQFRKLARGGVSNAVQSMFALIAVSPGPLPEALVQAGSKLTVFDLAALPWSVGRWFTVRATDGKIMYSAAHPLLARQFRGLLGGLATEAEAFLLRYCGNWQGDTTKWALRWFPDLLTQTGRADQLFALARDDAFRSAQLAAYPDQPDLTLTAYRAAIRLAAKERDLAAVAEFMLRHAGGADAMKVDRTPLQALRGGSLEEAIRRAALYGPERAPLWTLLLVWELRDTGRVEEARQLLDGLRIADFPTRLSGWLGRAAMVSASPIATLAPERLAGVCHRLVLDETGGVEMDALSGLTWLAQRLVDTSMPDAALAVVEPLGSPLRNAIRGSIAARLAERSGSESALRWVGSVRRPREAVKAFTLIAVGRARAGDTIDAELMFQRARQAADAAGERRDWALADLAIAQARATWFAAAWTTVQDMLDPFSRAQALEALVTEEARVGHDTGAALEELLRLYAGQGGTRIGLRLASAYVRAGRTEEATATFDRVLGPTPDAQRRTEVARAQLETGDIEGAYATFRSADHTYLPFVGDDLVRAKAERSGLTASMALLDELAALGYDPRLALVRLAEWATETAEEGTARTLLARAFSTPTARMPWAGPAQSEALRGIATTLAESGRVDEARTVVDLIADERCRDDALPSLAAGLAGHGRVDEAMGIADSAHGPRARGEVVAAVALSLERKAKHPAAMEAIAGIDLIDVTNDALVRMGRSAADHRRYDDALDCRSRIRTGSISTDPERDSITSAIAVAQCTDGDLKGALTTVDHLHHDRAVSTCIADLAGTCRDPAALDGIRRRAEPLPDLFQLAPLIAVAAAHRSAGRTNDAQASLQSALACFEAARLSDDVDRVPWEYDRDSAAAAAAELILELHRAGLDNDAIPVREAVLTTPRLRRTGLRGLFFGYARDGRRELADWAIDAMDSDFDRGDALRQLMQQRRPPPYGNELVRIALRTQQRNSIPEYGLALAVAEDWDHLAVLFLPAAESKITACEMCANLAAYAPASGLIVARVLAATAQAGTEQ